MVVLASNSDAYFLHMGWHPYPIGVMLDQLFMEMMVHAAYLITFLHLLPLSMPPGLQESLRK